MSPRGTHTCALGLTHTDVQVDAGTRLHDLETQLALLVGKDFELQLACARLSKEVNLLREEAKNRCGACAVGLCTLCACQFVGFIAFDAWRACSHAD